MQRFINNWSAALTASALAADTQLSIDPADAAKLVGLGDDSFYQPTLVEFSTVDGVITESAWEIIKITAVEGGLITVERGLESTAARDWPVGAFIGLRVTAQLLSSILSRLEALETPEVQPPADNEFALAVTVGTSPWGDLGWTSSGDNVGGSCAPSALAMAAPTGEVPVIGVFIQPATEWASASFYVKLEHEFAAGQLVSVEAQGIGTLLAADAAFFEASGGQSTWEWTIESADWVGGESRALTLTFSS